MEPGPRARQGERKKNKRWSEDHEGFDVAIVGGGYAGLSAALLLGHYIIRTVIFDSGPTRNSTTEHVHGYMGLYGISPRELLTMAWNNVLQFKSVRRVKQAVVSARRGSKVHSTSDDAFHLTTQSGREFRAKYVIIATGVRDIKPRITNFTKFDGRGAWHCPHCDGIETTGKKLVVISTPDRAVAFAKLFLGWTRDITLFIEEKTSLDERAIRSTPLVGSGLSKYGRREAERLGMRVVDGETITEILPGADGSPRAVMCTSGKTFDAQVLFYNLGFRIRNEIAKQLGCELDDGFVKVNSNKETSVKRVYAAGDIDTDKHYVVLSAAAGAVASFSIYESILGQRLRDLR